MPMKEEELVSRDPDVMSGEMVFTGTRVEVKTFVDHLKAGHSLDGFPSVSREQAVGYLEMTLDMVLGKPRAHALR
jgi:uncharacterized protein (DUF433 family)